MPVYASQLFFKVFYLALNFYLHNEYLKAVKKELVLFYACTRSPVLFNYL